MAVVNQPFRKEQNTVDSMLQRIWKVKIFITMVCMMHIQDVAQANSITLLSPKLNLSVSLSPQIKYLLLWTKNNTTPVSRWLDEQQIFIDENCPVSNCYITARRDFFGENMTKFDAVIFNGRNLKNKTIDDLPRMRSPRQKYIYLNLESSDNQPICNSLFNGFFNWTATYKLNSDIVINYLEIINAAGEVVGPRTNMTWTAHMSAVNETLLSTLQGKTKAAAWFVTHCTTRTKRENYALLLRNALKKHNLTLDIYGPCLDLRCPRSDWVNCNQMLTDHYFFYLAFENSFEEDYITEKVLIPLVSGVVPILYGGANYSRFLPPGSYVDARLHSPEDLAALMASIISNPAVYRTFFYWRDHYSYRYPANLCRLCEVLNDQTKFEAHSVYQDFKHWWNPNYKERCKNKKWGS